MKCSGWLVVDIPFAMKFEAPLSAKASDICSTCCLNQIVEIPTKNSSLNLGPLDNLRTITDTTKIKTNGYIYDVY
jgi:hypothetical protein